MVHLIYKPHLQAVFVCIKYDDAISFAQKIYICLCNVGFKLPKKVPGDLKKIAWQLWGIFSGIFSKILRNMPGNKLYRRVQISWTIIRHLFWYCPAHFLGLPGIFFPILPMFFFIFFISLLQYYSVWVSLPKNTVSFINLSWSSIYW